MESFVFRDRRRFDDLLLDSQGSPIPQGMQVTVNDGMSPIPD